jgi:hypothetical protein
MSVTKLPSGSKADIDHQVLLLRTTAHTFSGVVVPFGIWLAPFETCA